MNETITHNMSAANLNFFRSSIECLRGFSFKGKISHQSSQKSRDKIKHLMRFESKSFARGHRRAVVELY